jgi:Cu-processing system permease protein
MNATALFALVVAGFTEARRNRVTVVLGVFAATLILLTTVMLNTTVFTLDRAVTNFGLGVMSVLLVGLTVFLTVGMLSREIEKRTLFLIISRPVSRQAFVVGRALGVGATLTVLLAVMALFYATQVVLFEVPPTWAMVAAVGGLWVELMVLASLGIFFSSFTGQLVAGISVLGLYFIGHLTPDLYRWSQRQAGGLISDLAAIAFRVLPNLDRFDYRDDAAYALTVNGAEFAGTVVYGLAWCVALLTAAAFIFSRRDLK